ncbi:MAG: hypothetical protein BRC34_00925 [Cyanobacteria bacterium QH_1_48_107]|nr:MAG: hypothetical protein BRC34_00925 [Cyanobacteria bacterium QH_1_48_107]
MKGTKISFFAGLLFLMTPLGCQGNNQNSPATESDNQAAQATENSPDNVERSAPKPPAAAPAEAQQQKEAVEQSGTPMTDKVMQTQRGPYGMKVNLIKADVTGKLLTVEIQYVYPEGKGGAYASASTDYHIKDVSYIDTATSKIYGVVKEKSGSWMAAPLNDKEKVSLTVFSGKSKTVWFMFPAPSPETNLISLNVPGVGPFKVKVRR